MSISTDILSRLEDHVIGGGLIASGDKLLLGISGGADSSALLYLFSRLRYLHNLSLLAVHVNHQLRADASDADEKHVKELCVRLNVPLIIRKLNLTPGADLENRARIARFEAFHNVLKSYRFQKIVLGHHKWDQAETVLLNLLRGSGLSGLSGIRGLQDKICHPLLIFSPEELKKLLTEQSIVWREDESNFQNQYTRNRLRNELIPKLQDEYNPQVKDKLCDAAAIISKADIYIRERAQRKYKKLLLVISKEQLILSLPDLIRAPDIEQYYIMRFAYQAIAGVELDFLSTHVREIKGIMFAEGSKYISLPHGVYVRKQYQELIFSSQCLDHNPGPAQELIIEPERARAVHMDHRFSFKYLKVLPHDYKELDKNHAMIDLDKLTGSILIRSRKEGDRFMPLGMKDMKKLKDFFIDEKVAKYDRDLVPIFADGEKLIWVCGHRIDERVKVDKSSSRFLMIKAEPLTSKPRRAASRLKRGNYEFDEL